MRTVAVCMEKKSSYPRQLGDSPKESKKGKASVMTPEFLA